MTQRPDCTPRNLSVGYWQLARVYAISGRPAEGLRYADRCLAIGEEAALAPFSIAYAHEARARALDVAGDKAESETALAKARELTAQVTDEESKKLLEADLKTIGGT